MGADARHHLGIEPLPGRRIDQGGGNAVMRVSA